MASATATQIIVALLGCVEAFQDEPIYPHIKTVHVINSCHLDIGFADSSANIINRYFEHHLPLAASLGAQMAKGGSTDGYGDDKLGFMFQSWVLNLFLDCPVGLACAARMRRPSPR